MAKKNTDSTHEDQALVVAPSTAVGEAVDFSEFAQDTPEQFGKGDLALPFVGIAQSGSPELKRQEEEKFIKGCKVGDFFNNVTRRFWPGFADAERTPPVEEFKDGILYLPVYYTPSYTQWWPRDSKEGKGFVNDFGADASIMNSTSKEVSVNGHPNPKGLPMLPDGTYVQDAALYFGIWVDPVNFDYGFGLISMKSTQRKKARKWNTIRQDLKATKPDGTKFKATPYFHVWRVTSTFESNDQGDWFGYKVELLKRDSHGKFSVKPEDKDVYTIDLPGGREMYAAAKELDHMVKSGAAKVDHSQTGEGDGGNGSSSDDAF